jgi:hypothetical protein
MSLLDKVRLHISDPNERKKLIGELVRKPLETIARVTASANAYIDTKQAYLNLNRKLKRPKPTAGIDFFHFLEGKFSVYCTSSGSISLLLPRPLRSYDKKSELLWNIRSYLENRFENLFRQRSIRYFYGPTGQLDNTYNNGIVCSLRDWQGMIELNYIIEGKGGLLFTFEEDSIKYEILSRFPTKKPEGDYLFIGTSITVKDLRLDIEMNDESIMDLALEIGRDNSYLKSLNNQCGFLVIIDGVTRYINTFVKYNESQETTPVPLVAGLLRYLLNKYGVGISISFVMLEENHTAHPVSNSEVATEARQYNPIHFGAFAFLEENE